MNLIRAMLLHYEGDGFDLSAWTEAERMFHAELLVEAEFLKGTVIVGADGHAATVIPIRLTWQGYEFLDSIRNETVWTDALTKVGSAVGTVSVAVFQQVVQSILYKTLCLEGGT